jgi:hypothetical protein
MSYKSSFYSRLLLRIPPDRGKVLALIHREAVPVASKASPVSEQARPYKNLRHPKLDTIGCKRLGIQDFDPPSPAQREFCQGTV